MTAIIIFFVLHWYGSLFFQTFFLHRYAAHKAFTMSPFWEKVFYVLTWVFQGSNYLSAYGYGVMHRMHHAFADTEEDPHSPKYSTSIFDMMWKTKTVYSQINKKQVEVDPKFTKDVPDWRAFDNLASSYISRIAWGTFYVMFYFYFAPSPWFYLLLPIHFLMAPIHGAIINWFAHKVGYISFKVKDTSKNLMPWDIFMMGEGYHNNHHTHGTRANFAIKWYEFDPSYVFIKLFDVLGIIKLSAENKKSKSIKLEEVKAKAA